MPRLLRLLPLLLLLSPLPASVAHAWQQRVEYTMEIALDVPAHSYDGKQTLRYTNNSPDTLREVFYHLYYEAFKPGSVMDRRNESLPDGHLHIGSLSTDEQGQVAIAAMTQDGLPVEWDVEETILRVRLAQPLLPGATTSLAMAWRTRIPKLTRRGGWMSREGVEFSMSQWYPKLCEYDASGWHNDEYAGREFYGVWGNFNVAITLPARYVVGATGTVMNPQEVRCGYQVEFPNNGRPSPSYHDTIIAEPAKGETGMKTWRFRAENVHDFAWVADPDYLHRIAQWNGITIHILVKRGIAFAWGNAAEYTIRSMEYFTRRFGEYTWPQFTVAMAGDGGMEYPMLIMITGNRGQQSLASVIAHELGHQWFYGMVGNNETQEAWMDEGFTQFLTEEAMRNVLFPLRTNPFTGLDAMIYPWDDHPWRDVESTYGLTVGGFIEPLSTFHDWHSDGLTAREVYFKGMAVVRMLRDMLGEDLFDHGIRTYVNRWRYRHPSYRDFEKAMEDATGMRLDWFFNQWVVQNTTCDYAIDAVGCQQAPNGTWQTTVELSNRDHVVMPLDLQLHYDDGTIATANIPIEFWRKPGMDFNLPRWSWMERKYRATFATPKRVEKVVVDPSLSMLDLDRTNNTASTGFLANLLPESSVGWWTRWEYSQPLEKYAIRLRPTLWYAQADGVQPGFVADGGYIYDRYNAKAGLYYNVKSGRVDYDVRYNSTFGLLGQQSRVDLFATNNDGVQKWGFQLTKKIPMPTAAQYSPHTFRLAAEREVLVGPNYPNALAPWSGGPSNIISFGYQFATLQRLGNFFRTDLSFDASFASRVRSGGERQGEFTQWTLQSQGAWRWLGLQFGGDLFAGTSVGDPPDQRLFNAAGARSIQMHQNPIHRLAMNARPGFGARNHLALPTEGYLLSLLSNGFAETRYGRSLLNGRITVGNLNPFASLISVPYLREFDVAAYAAAGWLFPGEVTFGGFRTLHAEAGVVASADLLELLDELFLPSAIVAALDSPAPVRLSLHLPFWASSPLLPKEGVAYRFAIGVSL
ncbi:MAG: M1 family metallopeptidase [Chlorobi bacterium]|nr:M1 family metallopeptidase [Chlorobiota bacterium]